MNDFSFNRLHKYVHEYDFPYHDFLSSFKGRVLEEYGNKGDMYGPISNIGCEIKEINDFLIPKLNLLVESYYSLDKPWAPHGIMLYVQDNKDSNHTFHNHMGAPVLTGVFYLDPPQNGGELEIMDLPFDSIKIKPKKDKVYIFPSWAYHRPLPQEDTTPRISFNWGYISSKRPVHKLSGDIW